MSNCYICNSKVTGNSSTIKCENDMFIAICPLCHQNICQENIFFNVDVMIVPVSEFSFEKIKTEKKYVCPISYIKKFRPKLIAFYRGGKIGAITSIAKVNKIHLNVRPSEIGIFLADLSNSWKNSNFFTIFLLEEILDLKEKIVRNKAAAIQNSVYKKFKTFIKAKELADLYSKRKH